MESRFVVDVDNGRDLTRAALVGELTRETVTALDEAYEGAATRRGSSGVVIDLSAVTHCDLVGALRLRDCHEAGSDLVGAPHCVRVAFERAVAPPSADQARRAPGELTAGSRPWTRIRPQSPPGMPG